MQPTEWRGLARNLAPELLEVSFVMETSITENSAINPDRITSKVLSVPASSHSVHTPTPIRPKHKLPDEAVEGVRPAQPSSAQAVAGEGRGPSARRVVDDILEQPDHGEDAADDGA